MALGPISRHLGNIRRRGWHLREDERRRQRQEMSDLIRGQCEEAGEPAPSDHPPDTPRPTPRAQWDEKRQVWVEWDDGRGEWMPVR